jgi:hypothetical protein
MTTRHALKSDGAWVELRDVEDLRARDRKKVDALLMGQVSADLDGNVSVDRGAVRAIISEVPEAVAALLVAAWEIPYLPDAKLPSIDAEALDDLRLDDYNRLLELAEPAIRLFMPSSSRNVDDHADPASPSGPASD